ncbi:MAG: hypothetical protein ACJ77E_18735 [Gaiellaceae bacterium]
MAIFHPDTTRRVAHDGDAVLDELAYLTSKVGTLERDLARRQRRAAGRTAVSTAVVAGLAVAAAFGARLLAQSANVDLHSTRALIAIAAAVAVAGLGAAAFASRGTARSLLTYVLDAAKQPAPQVSQRDNLVTALLASLVIFGLYLDGWRHINLADNRAGAFLTWWHVPLYIGATVTGLWITTRNQSIRDLLRGRFDIAAVPAGYRLGVFGMGLLTAGAAGDAVWHTFYGIEQGIERTMSPFHIVLFTSAALILGSPLRAAWNGTGPVAPSFRRFFPALLSLTLTTAAISFIVQFLLPYLFWTKSVPNIAALGDAGENTRIVGVATVLTANLLFMAPLLFAMRRWRLPFGSATVLITTQAVIESSMKEMERGWLIAAALLAGLATDALIARLRVTPERVGAQRVVAGVAPLVLWLSYFGILWFGYGVGWERNIWLSAVMLAGLSGVLLNSLLVPGRSAVAGASLELRDADDAATEERLAA